jgi:hypothetical protein
MKRLIGQNYKTLMTLRKPTQTLRRELDSKCIDDHEIIYQFITTSKERHIAEIVKNQIRKFKNLRAKKRPTPSTTSRIQPAKIDNPETIRKSSIINLSNVKFTREKEKVLKLGLNYALPLRNQQDLIIESGISLEC